MGIKEDNNKGGFGSHVFYVCMQAADIFHLKVFMSLKSESPTIFFRQIFVKKE